MRVPSKCKKCNNWILGAVCRFSCKKSVAGCCGAARFDIFIGIPLDLNDMYWLAEILPQACLARCRPLLRSSTSCSSWFCHTNAVKLVGAVGDAW